MQDISSSDESREDMFWVVWSQLGGNPTVKHESEKEAVAEASRLARKHGDRKFYVLKAIMAAQVKDVEFTMLKRVP